MHTLHYHRARPEDRGKGINFVLCNCSKKQDRFANNFLIYKNELAYWNSRLTQISGWLKVSKDQDPISALTKRSGQRFKFGVLAFLDRNNEDKSLQSLSVNMKLKIVKK